MGKKEESPSIHPLWLASSIFDFCYFCCPECDEKSKDKQEFVNHASAYHKGAVETLQQISDGSLDDVYLSGVPLTTIYPINVKEEPIDDYDYMPDTNDFDHNGTNDEKDSNNISSVKSESKDPDWDNEGKLKSKK